MTSASVAPYLRLSEWNEIQPLLQFLQARGIDVHFVRVMRKLGLQFAQRADAPARAARRLRRAGIHALQFLQRAAQHARLA